MLKAIRKINSALTVEEDHNGHRWGWITCQCGDKPFTVNCTPRNPGIHAKQIRQWPLGTSSARATIKRGRHD